MSDLRPVTEYVTIELWEHEDRTFAYRMRSELGRPFDEKHVSQIVSEFSESILSDAYDQSPVVFSLMVQENGQTHVNWSRQAEFRSLSHFFWLKTSLHRAGWRIVTGASAWVRWKYPFWFCEWLLMRLERSPTRRLAGRAAAPARAPKAVSEQSEALKNSSAGAGGNVVWLQPRVTRD